MNKKQMNVRFTEDGIRRLEALRFMQHRSVVKLLTAARSGGAAVPANVKPLSFSEILEKAVFDLHEEMALSMPEFDKLMDDVGAAFSKTEERT